MPFFFFYYFRSVFYWAFISLLYQSYNTKWRIQSRHQNMFYFSYTCCCKIGFPSVCSSPHLCLITFSARSPAGFFNEFGHEWSLLLFCWTCTGNARDRHSSRRASLYNMPGGHAYLNPLWSEMNYHPFFPSDSLPWLSIWVRDKAAAWRWCSVFFSCSKSFGSDRAELAWKIQHHTHMWCTVSEGWFILIAPTVI